MSKNKTQFGLGKGLSSLIPSQVSITSEGISFKESLSNIFAEIDIEKISFNPFQPRKEWDDASLAELSQSIKENGLIQPITVRATDFGFQLITGERRTRAALKAGLKKIPAYIIRFEDDYKLLELAIIENVQREDLNPIDLANGYKKLVEECNLTQEEVAKRVGKDRSTITNLLRLLKLPIPIQDSLKKDEISLGHAKALLSLPDPTAIKQVWEKIKAERLSVRQTEQIVSNWKLKRTIDPKKKTKTIHKDENLIAIQNELMHSLGTKVIIEQHNNKGRLIIEFYNQQEFERLVEIITGNKV